MGEPTPILTQGEDADDNQVNDLTAKEENLDDGLDTKETEDAADETKSEETGDEKEEKPVEPTTEELLAIKDNEITQLRGMVRQVDRDFRNFKEEANNQPAPKESEDEFADLDEENEQPAIDVNAIYEKNRETQLDTYLETMRLSDKYGDVDDVVALTNFDDTVEMLANSWIENNPNEDVPKGDVIAGVEKQIWGQKNPWRYMYNVIKDTHPTYNKDTKTVPTPLKKENVVPSINNMEGAKKTSMAGWTAARIDALPEGELGTVPKDVYEKYMQNELK
jgi:hypothetical protein